MPASRAFTQSLATVEPTQKKPLAYPCSLPMAIALRRKSLPEASSPRSKAILRLCQKTHEFGLVNI